MKVQKHGEIHLLNIKSIVSALAFCFMAASASAQEYVPGEVIVKYKKNHAVGGLSLASKATSAKFTIKKSWDSMGIQHVQAKTGSGPQQSTAQMIEQLKNDPNVEFAEPNYILRKQSTGIEGSPMNIEAVR